MMRWIYIANIAVVFVILALIPPSDGPSRAGIAKRIALEAQVPNSVSGILLRNRLYDTAFEVLVFTLAVLGVQYAFSFQRAEDEIFSLGDPTMVILCRIGAMVSALVFLELGLRGHLAPGGGFAAGVAGGTAVGLVTLTGNAKELYLFYRHWHLASFEKAIVLVILLGVLVLFLLPGGTTSAPALGSASVQVLNMLVALKVAIGSWTIVLLFIRHRGLL